MRNKIKNLNHKAKEVVLYLTAAVFLITLGHCSIEDAQNNPNYRKHIDKIKDKLSYESILPKIEKGLQKGYRDPEKLKDYIVKNNLNNSIKDIEDVISNINGVIEENVNDKVVKPSNTPNPNSNITPVPNQTPNPTQKPVESLEPNATSTPTPTPILGTPTPNVTSTPVPTASSNPTPSVKPTITPKPSETPKPTATPTPIHRHVSDGKTHYGYIKGVFSEYNICLGCGKPINIKKHIHNHSSWSYNKKTGQDERTCVCGDIETRRHQHQSDGITHYGYVKGVYSEYNLCSKCGEKVNVKKHEHKWSNWTINPKNPNEEIRTCSCGKEETRPYTPPIHRHVSDGKTHYGMINGVFSEYNICLGCGKPINIKEHIHHHSSWTYNPKTGQDERTCVCGDIETRRHQHQSDGITHYGYVNGVFSEYNLCPKCGEKINVKKHEHKWSNWTINPDNPNEEIRKCPCGKEETRPYTPPIHRHVSDDITHYGMIDGVLCEYNICLGCGKPINIKEHTSHKFTDWIINPDNPNEEIRKCPCGETETRPYTPPHVHQSDGIIHYDTVNGKIIEYNGCLGCDERLNVKDHNHSYQMTSTVDHEHFDCDCGSNYNNEHNWDSGKVVGDKIIHSCTNEGCTQTKEETLECQHTNVTKTWRNGGTKDVCWYYEVVCNDCHQHLPNENHGHDPNSFVVNESTTGRTEDCYDCGYHQSIIYTEQQMNSLDIENMTNADIFDALMNFQENDLTLKLVRKNTSSNGGK